MMLSGEENMDVDSDVKVLSSTSSLEEAADARKKRLLEMKAKVEGTSDNNEDTVADPEKSLVFRSYDPISGELGPKVEKRDLFIVEREIQEQLADTEDTSMVEQVDVNVLAPRKVDWDLKRDVASRLEKLERRTQRAIATLIKERLSKGQTELAAAVNSGAYTAMQDDD